MRDKILTAVFSSIATIAILGLVSLLWNGMKPGYFVKCLGGVSADDFAAQKALYDDLTSNAVKYKDSIHLENMRHDKKALQGFGIGSVSLEDSHPEAPDQKWLVERTR